MGAQKSRSQEWQCYGSAPHCQPGEGMNQDGDELRIAEIPLREERACAGASSEEAARSTADEVARRSYGKLVAFLATKTRDVAAAEDALSEAFAAALENWPVNGCPTNPEGWLLTVARRKTIDAARRRGTGEAATAQLQILAEG